MQYLGLTSHVAEGSSSRPGRLSPSDISLHTLHPDLPVTAMSALNRRLFRHGHKQGTTDDGSSFFTARGTLSSVSPSGEVIEEDVLVWIGGGTTKTAVSTIRTIDTFSSDGTPMPSRILHLAHPPTSPSSPLDRFFEIDTRTLIADARDSAEAAFWSLVGGSLDGLTGLGASLNEYIGSLTLPLLLSPLPAALTSAPRTGADAATGVAGSGPEVSARLYADETLYTLRIPAMTASDKEEVDLGNTSRGVFVRKRAALPEWDTRQDRREEMGVVGHAWR